VLATTVKGYFYRISAKYKILEFITKYDEVCNELAAEVRQALHRFKVKAIDTTLEDFECDESEINVTRRRIAMQDERVKLEQARLRELKAQKESEGVITETELQKVRVEEARKKLEHVKLQILIDGLGPKAVAAERIAKQLAKVNVPQIIGGASGDMAEAMLSAMPYAQARDILFAMLNDSGKNHAVTGGRATTEPSWPTEEP
jgi:hypothetical protein